MAGEWITEKENRLSLPRGSKGIPKASNIPHQRLIEVQWKMATYKIKKSERQELARLAIETGLKFKPDLAVVLIRSTMHATTTRRGNTKKDPLGWHVTVSFKNATDQANGQHLTAHGYTKGSSNLELNSWTSDQNHKADTFQDYYGKEIWPTACSGKGVVVEFQPDGKVILRSPAY
ncbi:hypothetical protein BT63DRAFT_412427 [Microthyrium microscopicum]|uniref:Uncharacterized protein n=1 Tax=Microthyrium microscopicum TaxID=703497 RepID=A0A6A6UHW6_9PEZI|nr:hypothetical protein BT63DRAFT_412427 [Microthyrium microscopicum]